MNEEKKTSIFAYDVFDPPFHPPRTRGRENWRLFERSKKENFLRNVFSSFVNLCETLKWILLLFFWFRNANLTNDLFFASPPSPHSPAKEGGDASLGPFLRGRWGGGAILEAGNVANLKGGTTPPSQPDLFFYLGFLGKQGGLSKVPSKLRQSRLSQWLDGRALLSPSVSQSQEVRKAQN